MNNNVELCSDLLFHSAAHFTSSHEGNTGRNIYILILHCAVISLGKYTVYKMWAAAINMRVTETTFKNTIDFYFHFCFRDLRSHKFCFYYGEAVGYLPQFTRSDACQWYPGSVINLSSS